MPGLLVLLSLSLLLIEALMDLCYDTADVPCLIFFSAGAFAFLAQSPLTGR